LGQKYHRSNHHQKFYTYMDAKFISKQQYSSDLWPSKDKRNCMYIVDKLLKFIKVITNSVHLILDNFRIVGYPFSGRIPMDSSHFSLHFDSILSPKYLILKVLKRNFNPSVQTGHINFTWSRKV
jgi:hypothetical protein